MNPRQKLANDPGAEELNAGGDRDGGGERIASGRDASHDNPTDRPDQHENSEAGRAGGGDGGEMQ
jgi:hypothetical protein